MFLSEKYNKLFMAKLACLLFSLLAINTSYGSDLEPPLFTIPGENFSDSGYIQISWSDNSNDRSVKFQLEQADDPEFENTKLIYEGPDRASFISGLADGNYYYRIRKTFNGQSSGWSSAIIVKVEHHSLAMAFSLASIGLTVFLLTVAVVIKGIRNDREP